MGSRKQERADQVKEQRKTQYFASLKNNPTSPRKMRLVADMIRGMEVNKALDTLRFSPKEASIKLEKLLMSAIANWQAKNEGVRIEDSKLFVKEVFVNSGRVLKRLRPAPQGRAYRIRKRSNHVTIYLDSHNKEEKTDE
ncbi:MAG: 50S ribosomal protein L22 [Bacteroidales bacterium]|nr:50S ribosomal protein L22 [Bacteroidales bacterium]